MTHRKIGIVERNPSGHRLMYVRLLVEDSIRQGISPVLFAPPGLLETEEYRVHLASLENDFDTALIAADARLHVVQSLARQSNVDPLLIPDGNVWALEALMNPRVGRAPLTRLLVMRDPRWELMGNSAVKLRPLLKASVLKVIEALGRVELYWLREPGLRNAGETDVQDPIILDGSVEDILEDSRTLRTRLGMDDDTFWFGITGVLSDAKLSPAVLDALTAAASNSSRNVGLALIGPVSANAAWPAKMRQYPDFKVLLHDEVLTNYEVGVAIRAFDCLLSTYVNVHGPSATLAKAAALGVRTVSAGPVSMRRFAANITGTAGVPLDVRSLYSEFMRAINECAPLPRHQVGSEVFTAALLR